VLSPAAGRTGRRRLFGRGWVQTFYGSRAHLAAGKYDPALRTLTVDPKDDAGQKYRVIFVLRNDVVQTIYAGALPQVAYVEGCS
jgi:hypothetical protein